MEEKDTSDAMIRSPRDLDVRSFASTNAEEYKIFLIASFRAYFEEGKGRKAFGTLAPFIGRTASVPADLEDIHDCLSAEEQMAMREGCLLALEDTVHCDSKFRCEIAHNLIELSGLIRASRLVRVLPKLLNFLALHTQDDPKISLLYDAAFAAVTAAATTGDDTSSCLYELASQRAMPPRLAGIALLRLVEADPRGVVNHLAALWPQIDRALGWPPISGDYASDQEEEEVREKLREKLICDIYARVSIADFIGTLDPTRRSRQPRNSVSIDYQMIDDWWYQTLNSGSPRMTEILCECAASSGIDASGYRETLSADFQKDSIQRRSPTENINYAFSLQPYVDILKKLQSWSLGGKLT